MKRKIALAAMGLALCFVARAQDPDNNTFFHPDRNWKGQIRTNSSGIYIWCFLGCVDACDNTSYPGDCDPICNQICQPFIGNPGATPSMDKELPMISKPHDLWDELLAETGVR